MHITVVVLFSAEELSNCTMLLLTRYGIDFVQVCFCTSIFCMLAAEIFVIGSTHWSLLCSTLCHSPHLQQSYLLIALVFLLNIQMSNHNKLEALKACACVSEDKRWNNEKPIWICIWHVETTTHSDYMYFFREKLEVCIRLNYSSWSGSSMAMTNSNTGKIMRPFQNQPQMIIMIVHWCQLSVVDLL